MKSWKNFCLNIWRNPDKIMRLLSWKTIRFIPGQINASEVLLVEPAYWILYRNFLKNLKKRGEYLLSLILFCQTLCWISKELSAENSAGVVIEYFHEILGVIPRIIREGKLESSYINFNYLKYSANAFKEA